MCARRSGVRVYELANVGSHFQPLGQTSLSSAGRARGDITVAALADVLRRDERPAL